MNLSLKPFGAKLDPEGGIAKTLEQHYGTVQEALQTRIAEAADLVERSGNSGQWNRAQEKRNPDDRARLILALIDQVDPIAAEDVRVDFDTQRRLGAAIYSYQSLCKVLAAVGNEEISVLPAIRSQQLEARLGMLKSVEMVEQAIKAAGACPAIAKFPLKQLALLRENLGEQIAVLQKAPAPDIGPLLDAGKVGTAAEAGAALGKLLGDDKLGASLAALADKAKDKAKFTSQLGALAMLVDQASSAPDYSMTRTGDQYPTTRLDYRARRQQPGVMLLAETRLEGTLTSSQDGAKAVVDSQTPDKELEKLIAKRFLAEIGVTAKQAKGWKPNMEGIRQALEHELILPLRSLNETIQDMAAGHYGDQHEHYDEFRKVVTDITKAVFEGNFRNWRYSTPTSQEQMAVVDEKTRWLWMDANNVSIDGHAAHGGKLKTREEDGLDLFWVTKIGGPSHGFDRGPECLLPLLCNARSKAIVVDDTQWPGHPAARAYLRLLSTPDGAPTLYLEPLQRDFAHNGKFGKDPSWGFQKAVLEHAIQKSRIMGIPLSIPSWLGEMLGQLNVKTDVVFAPKYVLTPSGGVTEASDSLSNNHDWTQLERMVMDLGVKDEGGNARLVFDPKKA